MVSTEKWCQGQFDDFCYRPEIVPDTGFVSILTARYASSTNGSGTTPGATVITSCQAGFRK
jgi:hypothetical protein